MPSKFTKLASSNAAAVVIQYFCGSSSFYDLGSRFKIRHYLRSCSVPSYIVSRTLERSDAKTMVRSDAQDNGLHENAQRDPLPPVKVAQLVRHTGSVVPVLMESPKAWPWKVVSYLNSLAKSHHQVHRIVRGLNGVGVYLCTGWVLSSVIFMLIRPISSHHVAQLAPSQNPNFMQRWGCSPSKFPWTFEAKETMYLLEGKVKVYCDGHDGFFEIGAGDLVEFPKGMKVTWDVTEALNKHYSLEK
ncbi:hypothetical protein CK203_039330 [Vitis vinifera]|uniref:(S)-ureidoglycine aminohydrolase cupin domain-containing protein n=1 Tax=Vitis vinifera TaxID=29760 RepID=A0A438HGQ1_VITVI|nr:hypothetical protein CK203_039330 [Vitis vinifera]